MGPNYVALAIPFFFLFIGIELRLAKSVHRRAYRFTVATSDLGCGVTQQLLLTFFNSALIFVYATVYEHAHLFDLTQHPVAAWVIGFVGVDLCYYWWHRLSHRINVLWASHVTHHHSEDYNLAVALRQSVLTPITELPFWMPLALLGVPPLVFALHNALNALYQFWIHTELLPKLGRLEAVVNTPSHHRVHHAVNPRYIDKNFGGTLMIWDRMFGTLAIEQETCVYGISKPLRSFNPLWAQVHYFVDLWRASRRAPTWGDAIAVWYRGPEWQPDWFPGANAPKSDAAAAPYDVIVNKGMQSYVLVQFTIVIAVTFAFVMWGAPLPIGTRVAIAAWVLASLLACTGLLESRPWARPIEVARLLAVPAMIVLVIRS